MKIGTLEHNLSMIRGAPSEIKRSDPNPANLSRESRRILNESLEGPDRSQTTIAADFLTDATEIALAAFDDAYAAEYTTTGATDNRAIAMRAAVESIVALCAMEAEWKPGDPRCDQCDNGILATWVACPYCGSRVLKSEPKA
ncbi:MAG: hypothetical protein KGL39_50930 [Patescibacteria group bacterium]|nr:hypothetical protein [Patescibacteria group bacterium]